MKRPTKFARCHRHRRHRQKRDRHARTNASRSDAFCPRRREAGPSGLPKTSRGPHRPHVLCLSRSQRLVSDIRPSSPGDIWRRPWPPDQTIVKALQQGDKALCSGAWSLCHKSHIQVTPVCLADGAFPTGLVPSLAHTPRSEALGAAHTSHVSRLRADMTPSHRSLWFEPDGADVLIRCRGKQWAVHRDVLVDMSEWMEKYLPPAAKDVSQIHMYHPEAHLSRFSASRILECLPD